MTLETPAPSGQPAGRLERRKARTRAAILDAASQLFHQQGYEETSIQQIAELADTGVGTVYGYFAAKEQILREVLRAHSKEAVARYHAAVSDETPAIDRVITALDTFARYIHENRTVLLAAFQTAASSRPLDDDDADWVFDAYGNLIREGIERGELRDVPVGAAVRVLVGSYSMAMLRLGPWAGQDDEAATRAELEQVARALLAR
jgi:AcrR family transcriptional regulator